MSVQLRASEVIAVERRREFVFFTLKSGWIDDPFQSLVFDLDSNRPSTKAVRELFTLLDRPVYHVQYIKDGWYYCEYN